MSYAIEISGLTKRFPGTSGYKDALTFWRRRHIAALHGVDLAVPKGEVFGLVGPNGSGKSTILKILSGLVLPDQGSVTVNAAGGRVTYISGEERSLYWRLTGRQNLKFFAVLSEVPAGQVEQSVSRVLSTVSLDDAADERVSNYSSGMRQRLCLARGLLADSDVILLDEPTRSLDPVSSRNLWDLIRDELVGALGKTVVLATHDMEEATYLCSRVAILCNGRIQACDTVADLVGRMGGMDRYVITLTDMTESSRRGVEELRDLPWVDRVIMDHPNGHRHFTLEIAVSEPDVQIPLVVDHLSKARARVVEVSRVRKSLGDMVATLASSVGP